MASFDMSRTMAARVQRPHHPAMIPVPLVGRGASLGAYEPRGSLWGREREHRTRSPVASQTQSVAAERARNWPLAWNSAVWHSEERESSEYGARPRQERATRG